MAGTPGRDALTNKISKLNAAVCNPAYSRPERRRVLAMLVLLFLLFFVPASFLSAQTSVTTWHHDSARTSANTTEFLLTPSNVNIKTFGKMFTQAVDGFIVGHPLYLPGVYIPGQGTHNVVYVATMHDSVYAFDADNANAGPLWMTSILTYSPQGATTVPATVKRAAATTGWSEVGIVSTPVIDTGTGTLYLVAETYENGKVVHRLHALDVSNGQEKFGGPALITATYTLNGVTSTFRDTYQMNRPGLLLANGHVYIAFGSNCCNDYSQGWILSYNASTLAQEGAFDAEPNKTLASFWQKGAGISADSDGNIYGETGEGYYAAGTNLSTSVLKLSQINTTLTLADWFTPYNYQFLSSNDLDMAQGVLVLPDQPGQLFARELIAIGKEGTIYVLNRDNMGQLCAPNCTSDSQIIQEIPQGAGRESGTPVYWNNMVYFTGVSSPVVAYSLSNGSLIVPPAAQSAKLNGGGHALITANGNSNGILWFINSNQLWAIDAVTLKTLYTSGQAPKRRDTLPPLAHFATPIAADGKVFVGTQNSVAVYGLLPALSVVGGNGQSATVTSMLPGTLNVQAADQYTQNVVPGLTVTFSDGGKGGTFNPATPVTDGNGIASTSYTLPTKSGAYALTASAPGYAAGIFTETALAGSAKSWIAQRGYYQSAPVTTTLPGQLLTRINDSYGNGVPGVSVTFSDNGAGGTFSANPVSSDSGGVARVSYTTSTTAGSIKISASTAGLPTLNFAEKVTSGPAANITTVSGNNQYASPNSQLPQALVVKVTDQYGNATSATPVTFNDGGAGGSFLGNPAVTNSSGVASVTYTTSANTGTVTIQATAPRVSTPATFTITVQ